MGGEHRVAPLRSAVRAEEKTVFADQEAKTPAPAHRVGPCSLAAQRRVREACAAASK